MMKLKFTLRIKLLVYILLITAAIFITVTLVIGLKLKADSIKETNNLAKTTARTIAVRQKNILDLCFNSIQTLSKSLNGLKNIANIELIEASNNLLHANVEKQEIFNALWIDWNLKFVNPAWNRNYGYLKNVYYQEEGRTGFYSQTLDTVGANAYGIYERVKTMHQPIIIEPKDYVNYSSVENDEIRTSIALPLEINNQFAGVIGGDFSLSKNFSFSGLENDDNDNSYFLLSNNGYIIAHPDKYFLNVNVIDYFSKEDLKFSFLDSIQAGKPITFQSRDRKTGEKVFYAFAPIQIGNSDYFWCIVVKKPLNEVIRKANKIILLALFLGLIGILIIGFVIWFIAGNITIPLFRTTKILKSLARGDISTTYKIEIDSHDELGEMTQSVNLLIDGLNSTAQFAKEIGKGNLDAKFEKLSQDDVLGESLIDMRESLKSAKIEEDKRKIEDAKQNWATQGIAKFSDILRQKTDNLEEFTYNIISNLVKYVEANQGGLFIVNESEEKGKVIDLVSCYAYDRKKFLEKQILPGEGLVGRCVLEKETIHLTEIPEDYIQITSGLGYERPRSLLIVPLILNEDVYGVIEIASFKNFESHIVSFIEKIGESIASTLSNVKINIKTSKLLEETRIQAEELASQEEEMRQNLEELQATQEESARKEAELSGIVAAMSASLLMCEYDIEGVIISANADFARIYGIDPDQIVGMTFRELSASGGISPEKINQIWYKLQHNEMVKIITQLIVNEQEIWVNQTFAPILNTEGHPYKVLNIGIDITETKNQEKQVKLLLDESQKKNEELAVQEQMLKKNLEELTAAQAEMKKLKDEDEVKNKKMLETIEAHRLTLINIINEVPGKIFVKDKDGKMILVNSAVLKAHNATSDEEIIGKSDFDFLEDKSLAQKVFDEEQEIIRTGPRTFEQREYVHDADVYLRTTKMPFYIPYLNQTGILGIQLDISDIRRMEEEAKRQNIELRKAQEAMYKEKALMDALMDNVPDSIYFKDEESRFLRISKSMLGLFKAKSFDEVMGKRDFDFFSGEHAQQAYEDEQKIIHTGKSIINMVEKETFDDGSESWVATTKMPLKDKDANIIGTFGISRTVTDIKKMEIESIKRNEKLKEQEEQLRQNLEDMQSINDELEKLKAKEAEQSQKIIKTIEENRMMLINIINELPEKIFLKDKDGKFIVANQAVADAHKLKVEELIGKSDFDFFNKKDATLFHNKEIEIINSGKAEEFEEGALNKLDGRIFKSIKKPFYIPFLKQTGLLGIQYEITEIKLREAMLKEKKEILNQKVTELKKDRRK